MPVKQKHKLKQYFHNNYLKKEPKELRIIDYFQQYQHLLNSNLDMIVTGQVETHT